MIYHGNIFSNSSEKYVNISISIFFFISSKFSTNNYENILRKRNARNMTMDNNNNKGNNYKKGDISNNIKSKSI